MISRRADHLPELVYSVGLVGGIVIGNAPSFWSSMVAAFVTGIVAVAAHQLSFAIDRNFRVTK